MLKDIFQTVLGKRPLSVHDTVVLLLAWLIAPLAVGSAIFVLALWLDEHAKVEQGLQGWTSGIVHSVELHLAHARSQLEVIAALPEVDSGDFGAIHRFAREVVADHPETLVALVRGDGQLLVNTSVPFGTSLPNLWQMEDRGHEARWNGHALPVSSQGLTRKVFSSGQIAHSSLYYGVNLPRPRVAMAIPVRRQGKLLYALMLSHPAEDLSTLLGKAGLPGQAGAVLLDDKGAVIASTGALPYGVAQRLPLPAPGAKPVALAERDGTAMATASGMTSAGQTLLVGFPQAQAYGTARMALIGWGLVFAAALILSILGAARITRRLAEPLRRLAAGALAGGPLLPQPSNIHEIDLLDAALRAAARNEETRREEHLRRIEAEKKEEAMQASEAQIRRVFDSIYVSIVVLDPDGRVIELNRAPLERAGIARTDAVGQPFWDCYWWSYDPAVQQMMRESVAEAARGEVVRYNVPARLESGRLVMADLQLSPLTGPSGEVNRLIACAVDVQDRVDAIRSLQVREAQAREVARKLDEQRWLLDAALDVTPAGIIVSDGSGRVLRMNRANQRLWGVAPLAVHTGREVHWKGWWAQGQEKQGEPVHPGEWPLARALRNAWPESSVVDIEPFDAPGTRKTVDISAAPVLDEKGLVVGGVVVQMDITDRVRAEAALRLADRHKDEFLATLGHELRNPLGPIRSAIHILRKQHTDEPHVVRAQEVIERQTKHMTRLVDDLLDVARITQGSLKLEREVLKLQDVLAAAVEAVAPTLEAKRVQFRQELSHDWLFVQGDATRLSQALVNLLANACKFTGTAGEIVLRLRSDGSAAVIEVQDNGIGLPPDGLERIFGLFVQEQPSGAAGNSGLGIGLALSRSLLAMHGGELAAASAGLGKGSTFTARLPLVAAMPPAVMPVIQTKQERPARAHRVLLVDDNRDGCDTMKELLELSGFEASTAYDGASALAAARNSEHDALILDIGLPDINGYELCRRIRAHIGPGPVMVALTGWGQARDKMAAEAAGFDTHITKPADPDELCSTLTKLLDERNGDLAVRPAQSSLQVATAVTATAAAPPPIAA